MNQPVLKYFPKYFTSKAILLFFVLLAAVYIVTRDLMPPLWIFFGVVEILIFYYFSNRLSVKWINLPEPLLLRRVFRTGLAIRIGYVIFAYFFYTIMTGQPYEFEAGDSIGYQGEAEWMLSMMKSGDLDYYFTVYIQKGISDSGFPFFLFLVYGLMGGTVVLLIPRLLLAIIGAYISVIGYRLAKRNFGQDAARLAAIFLMLSPTLIYYCGIPLKETLMVFLLLLFVERADLLFRKPGLDMKLFLVVCLTGFSLFFFRTVLAGAAWASLFITLLFAGQRYMGPVRRIVLILGLIIASLFIFRGRIYNETQAYIGQAGTHQAKQMQNYATRAEGNKLAVYGSRAIFIPLMISAPFPSLVNAGNDNSMMLCGATYSRNIYSFFVFVALIFMIKRQLVRSHIFILSVMGSYLMILASSGFAFAERFHLPAVPFLLILAAFGVTRTDKSNMKYFLPFILIISLLIIGWNYFRLAGRGMV
jgi:hypothetical protein